MGILDAARDKVVSGELVPGMGGSRFGGVGGFVKDSLKTIGRNPLDFAFNPILGMTGLSFDAATGKPVTDTVAQAIPDWVYNPYLALQGAQADQVSQAVGGPTIPSGGISSRPPSAKAPASETLTGTPYQTPNVYLPSVNGQTTDYQTALNRLAMGGSPYEALQGLLGPGQLAQQGSDGYTGTNAGNSGLLGATPINTGTVPGYQGNPVSQPPVTGGNLPPPVIGGKDQGKHSRGRVNPNRRADNDKAQVLQVRELARQLAGDKSLNHMQLLSGGYLKQARQQLGLPIYGD